MTLLLVFATFFATTLWLESALAKAENTGKCQWWKSLIVSILWTMLACRIVPIIYG